MGNLGRRTVFPVDGITICMVNGDHAPEMSFEVIAGNQYDLVYADMMYDDFDFDRWIPICKDLLKSTGSIFVQTDYRSVAELKCYMDNLFGRENFINWIVWPYDWGGRPKNAFGRKHDDILWYSKEARKHKFYRDAIAIPKSTAGTSMDKSKDGMKIPTDVWDDIGNFHTMSGERISEVKWQKPERLIERIVLASTLEGDNVIDPFGGSGTTAAVCAKLNRNCTSIEIDEKIHKKAVHRIKEISDARHLRD